MTATNNADNPLRVTLGLVKLHAYRDLVALITALTFTLSLTQSEAAPTKYVLPVGNSYRDYAVSKSPKSLDQISQNMESKGQTMFAIYGEAQETDAALTARRNREIAGGYLSVKANFSETSLRVPLGWNFDSPFGYFYRAGNFSPDSFHDSIALPGQKVSITAQAEGLTDAQPQSPTPLLSLRKTARAQVTARLKKQGFVTGPTELLVLSEESFAVRALKMTKQNKRYSYIEVYQSRSTRTERAVYARGQSQHKNEILFGLPRNPLAMSLLAPADLFPKYLGLLGLELRDAGINFVRKETLTLETFEARSAHARKFVQLADQTLRQIKAGQIESYVNVTAAENMNFAAKIHDEGKADHKFTPKEVAAVKQSIAADARNNLIPALRKSEKTPARTVIVLLSNRDPLSPIFIVYLHREPLTRDDSLYVIGMNLVGGKPALQSVNVN